MTPEDFDHALSCMTYLYPGSYILVHHVLHGSYDPRLKDELKSDPKYQEFELYVSCSLRGEELIHFESPSPIKFTWVELRLQETDEVLLVSFVDDYPLYDNMDLFPLCNA